MDFFKLPHLHGDEEYIDELHEEVNKIERFNVAAEIFKQLSDTTRIRIFFILCHKEVCVINLAALLNMSSPAISHHLRPLKACGLIESRRDGKEVYYKASNNEVATLLHSMIENVIQIACPKKR